METDTDQEDVKGALRSSGDEVQTHICDTNEVVIRTLECLA